jgi:hypothetical protein
MTLELRLTLVSPAAIRAAFLHKDASNNFGLTIPA